MNDPILLYVTYIIVGIAGIWAPFRWKQSSKAQRALIIIVFVWFLSDYAEYLLAYFSIHNLWLITLSNLIEFNLNILIFYYLKSDRRAKAILIMTGLAFTAFWIIAKFTFEPFTDFGVYTAAISRLFQILISITILFELLNESNVQIRDDFRFWFVSGTLIYSAGSIILHAFFMEIMKIPLELFKLVWHINLVLNIICILLYARGLLCKTTQ
jgi:hypothetical protein